MKNKKRIVNLEYFREMLQICLRIPNQPVNELPFEEEILAFLIELGHNEEIKKITDVEHKDAKKSNEMYYPRFTKVIVNFFMTKDQSIPRRNKDTQQYDAILLDELTNEAIRNSESFKEYYAIASGAKPPKIKASVKKTQSSSDSTVPPPTDKGTRLKTSVKGKQPATSSKPKDEGTGILPGVLDVPTYESDDEEISWKSSEDDDDDDDVQLSEHDEDVDDQSDDDSQDDQEDDDDDQDAQTDSDNDGDEFIHPKFSTHDEEDKDEESFDPIARTYFQVENSDDEGNDDNSYGIDSIFESTPWVDVPVTTTVEPLLLSAPTLPPPSIPIMSQVQQTPAPSPATLPSSYMPDLPNFISLFGFDHRFKTLEVNFSEFMQTNQFVEAISSILSIVDKYLNHRMNEAMKVVVQLQSDRLRDEAQAENEDFLKILDENIQKIIKEQVRVQVSKILPKIKKSVNEQLEAELLTHASNSSKTSYVVSADLSELELKKILIEKMESNKYIHRSDEQKNLYKALVDAYKWSKSYQNIANESAPTEEPMHITQDLEEPAHQEFETCTTDDQPIAEASQHPEWFQKQTEPPTPDRAWNKTLPATHTRIQPWISNLAKKTDSHTLFDELMDTPVDFSAFVMNHLKVDTLTLELLAGPTYELTKGSCKSLVKLELFLEEVYKATTDQLD
nr:hypothetical protein [Tanacetum cinerariifolium]